MYLYVYYYIYTVFLLDRHDESALYIPKDVSDIYILYRLILYMPTLSSHVLTPFDWGVSREIFDVRVRLLRRPSSPEHATPLYRFFCDIRIRCPSFDDFTIIPFPVFCLFFIFFFFYFSIRIIFYNDKTRSPRRVILVFISDRFLYNDILYII